ncbi:class F sortase [Streptomyces kunmingensis]|uniref:Class F sortase n=1 Tax=Streptomyces kunmingensis TaxID=68225 RepID=A0ABU6C432_9ACTN|nr:class F sortase [Streptomyces kunmingensis]MEB3959424.1 class F sortase [Streptomyces kunmingensis]
MHQPRWRATAVSLLVLLAPLTACSSGAGARISGDASAVPRTGPPSGGPTSERPRSGEPERVTIDSIGVDSALLPLGLNQDGTVEVPPAEQGMTAGWYTGAATPGERGPAVIIGHNDTKFGRAVFHNLRKLRAGADVAVRNSSGGTAHFKVTSTETVSKKAFPTKKVYGATNTRALRLITCDGTYDAQGHPVDNLIVYAELTRD